METSLHRELKSRYAIGTAQTEVRVGSYRIDVVTDRELVEIQHGSLSSIRDKVRRLLDDHRVLIVKPIVVRKTLIKQGTKDGEVCSRRMSPKRGTFLDVFDELVHFTRVFPHPRLSLEVVLVEIEEWRYPGHGRRRRWRRNDHVVADQILTSVGESRRVRTAADLELLLPGRLPAKFHTGELAASLSISRPIAQRVAYCLREMGAIKQVGKQGNAIVYQRTARATRKRKKRAA